MRLCGIGSKMQAWKAIAPAHLLIIVCVASHYVCAGQIWKAVGWSLALAVISAALPVLDFFIGELKIRMRKK